MILLVAEAFMEGLNRLSKTAREQVQPFLKVFCEHIEKCNSPEDLYQIAYSDFAVKKTSADAHKYVLASIADFFKDEVFIVHFAGYALFVVIRNQVCTLLWISRKKPAGQHP